MSALAQLSTAQKVFGILMSIGLTGILFILLFGNLQGNLGFDTGSQGEIDSDNIINNLTGGVVTFFSFANVWFTLLAVSVLIAVIIGVISMVGGGRKGGFAS